MEVFYFQLPLGAELLSHSREVGFQQVQGSSGAWEGISRKLLALQWKGTLVGKGLVEVYTEESWVWG